MKRILGGLAGLVFPATAFAHTGAGASYGMSQGFLHPVSGMDHVLAMVAVGFFAYVLGGRALWLVPAVFVAMLSAGGFLGMSGFELPFVEAAIGLSVIVIGMAAAIGQKMPVAAAMALVGGFAIFHGFAHGAEMPQNASGFSYGIGFMLATALLHAAGIAACFTSARVMGRQSFWAARVGGGAAALAGVAIMGAA